MRSRMRLRSALSADPQRDRACYSTCWEVFMTRISIVVTLAIEFTAGCGSKKKPEHRGAGAGASGTPAAVGGAGRAPAAVKLPKLGLALDAQGDVTVGDAITGDGHMLQGAGIGALTVQVATAPQTID